MHHDKLVHKSHLAVDARSAEDAGQAVPTFVADPVVDLVGVGLSRAAPGLVPQLVHGHAGQEARQEGELGDLPIAPRGGVDTKGPGAELFGGAAGEAGGAEDSEQAVLVAVGAVAQAVDELFPCHLGRAGRGDRGTEVIIHSWCTFAALFENCIKTPPRMHKER